MLINRYYTLPHTTGIIYFISSLFSISMQIKLLYSRIECLTCNNPHFAASTLSLPTPFPSSHWLRPTSPKIFQTLFAMKLNNKVISAIFSSEGALSSQINLASSSLTHCNKANFCPNTRVSPLNATLFLDIYIIS